MADQKKGTLDDATIEREREWNARVDWFLQSLVEMVNSSAMSFGVTLSVGGVLVSGELVGGQHYFEGFGAEFTQNFSDEKAAKGAKESFAKMGEIYRKGGNDATASGTGTASGPSYIHLRNARFFQANGTPVPNNKGIWWRGKLSAVDGFTLGMLKAE
ncbi:MAG: gas vesicle accessory protein GvpU [Hyalangium sp.]|uniref:gas vesicle accessory protein GvpU n=1 Tax=Hyalangium sp. TaxID=2028555 RepID=UPI00389A476F